MTRRTPLKANDSDGGTKNDLGKPQIGLLSSRWLRGTADVLGFGLIKYGAHNWRKGIKSSRLYDALQRHMLAWNDGEDIDPESGLPHLYHASCCLMFLAETMETQRHLDDRYKGPTICPSCKKNEIRGWCRESGEFRCSACIESTKSKPHHCPRCGEIRDSKKVRCHNCNRAHSKRD